MAEVLQIEAESFDEPWDEQTFLKQLSKRNTFGYVAELREQVVGFAVCDLAPKSIRLINLAVAVKHRNRKVARAMLAKLESKLSYHRRERILVTVGEKNLPAQKFFRSCGFLAKRVLRGFYEREGGREDGYEFEFKMETP